ncbi:MAG: DNA cytosine methyltransferase [Verrucomicrobiota bacterium]
MNYYNEFDKHAAAWLEQLIAEGLIPPGEVDQRSISDVTPNDLSGFTQCHFFAGIAGWPLTLQLAGWPADRPVWTGSCPCQPFSVAGKRKGAEDSRHLWPVFAGLIAACQPPTVFGEQVASADGRLWLAGVFADLENMGYQRAGADLCAAGVRSPHIRQRLYWVADAGHQPARRAPGSGKAEGRRSFDQSSGCGDSGFRLADSIEPGLEGHGRHGDDRDQSGRFGAVAAGSAAESSAAGEFRGLADSAGNPGPKHERQPGSGSWGTAGPHDGAERGGDSVGLEHPAGDGREQWRAESGGRSTSGGCAWGDGLAIPCRDGKFRRIPAEPALFPLADGLSFRVGPRRSIRAPLLRGAGNAIVPQVAAGFVQAFLEI